jgi:hypothetical protein
MISMSFNHDITPHDWHIRYFGLTNKMMFDCDLEIDWKNFNFFHLEIIIASEHLIRTQPRVIPIRMSKVCETACVLITAINEINIIPRSEYRPTWRMARDCIWWVHKRKRSRFTVPAIFNTEKKTLLSVASCQFFIDCSNPTQSEWSHQK